MNIYQFILEITPYIYEFLIDLIFKLTDIKCVLYGTRALNYYIICEYLKSNSFDYDIVVYNKNNIDCSEEIGNLFVNYLNNSAQSILIKHNCSFYFSLEKSQYSATYKILVNNKPLIDISNANDEYKELLDQYPINLTNTGYYIHSFEWLLNNLISILRLRTVSNNHIWEKTIKKSKMIIFQYNHFNILNINKTTQINSLILKLSNMLKFNCDRYISSQIYDNQCMKYQELESKFIIYKNTSIKKEHKLQQTINELNLIINDLKEQNIEIKKKCNNRLSKQEHYYENNISKIIQSQVLRLNEKENEIDLKLKEFDNRIKKSFQLVKLNTIENKKLLNTTRKILKEIDETTSDNISEKIQLIKQIFNRHY